MPYDELPTTRPPELREVHCPKCGTLFVFPCGVVRQDTTSEPWRLVDGLMQRVPAPETWWRVELDFVCLDGHAFMLRVGSIRGVATTAMVLGPDLTGDHG